MLTDMTAAESVAESRSAPPVRILVADHHDAMRAGLRSLLETFGYAVVGMAANGDELTGLFTRERPDLLIVETHQIGWAAVPCMAGLRTVLRTDPGARVLIYTMYPDAPEAWEARQMGARSVVAKDGEIKSLLAGIALALAP